MDAPAAAAVAVAAAAAPVSGRGDDTTPGHPQQQQPAAATMASSDVTSKRPGASDGSSMEGLYLHDLGADAAATARKKVDMRPSPRWGCRQRDGQAAAAETFAAACLPMVPPAAAVAPCKSGQTEAVPVAPVAVAAAAAAAKPVVSAAKVGGIEEEAAAEKPKKKRPSRRGEAKSKGEECGRRWTKEEDQRLREAVKAIGPANWRTIATEWLGGHRSDVQCLHRWQKVLQPGLVKGPWTDEEDAVIVDCIRRGVTKWSEIAEKIPGRLGKQCRDRWVNHLDPDVKKGEWTEEEDAILVAAQAQHGNAWTTIARLLPGRSENTVKNRWNSATRRRAKAAVKAAATLTSLASGMQPPPQQQQQQQQGTKKKTPAKVSDAQAPTPARAAASQAPAPTIAVAPAAPTPAPPAAATPPQQHGGGGLAYDACWDFNAPGITPLEPFHDYALSASLLNMYMDQPPPQQPPHHQQQQGQQHLPPPPPIPTELSAAAAAAAATAARMPTPYFHPPAAAAAAAAAAGAAAVPAAATGQQQQQQQPYPRSSPVPTNSTTTATVMLPAAAAASSSSSSSYSYSAHKLPRAAFQHQQQPQHAIATAVGWKPPQPILTRPSSAGASSPLVVVPPASGQPSLYAAPEMEFLHSPTAAGGASPVGSVGGGTHHLLSYLPDDPHSEFLC